MKEIVVPHDISRGPLAAVRRMLIHSSMAELKELGLYERYSELIDRGCLERIKELIGPGWMPVELAMEHYRACDQLRLSDDIILQAGKRAGDKMGSALLVGGAQPQVENKERGPWQLLPALARMGRRIYDGASAQYVRTGPNNLEIEHIHNPLFSYYYYRVAHGGFLRQAFHALNGEVGELTFATFRASADSITVRIVFR